MLELVVAFEEALSLGQCSSVVEEHFAVLVEEPAASSVEVHSFFLDLADIDAGAEIVEVDEGAGAEVESIFPAVTEALPCSAHVVSEALEEVPALDLRDLAMVMHLKRYAWIVAIRLVWEALVVELAGQAHCIEVVAASIAQAVPW